MRAPLKTTLASWAPPIKILLLLLFFRHLLYIGLFLFSIEGRGVSFVTDGIVDSILMN